MAGAYALYYKKYSIVYVIDYGHLCCNEVYYSKKSKLLSRFTIVSCDAKEKQALATRQISALFACM